MSDDLKFATKTVSISGANDQVRVKKVKKMAREGLALK